MSEPLQGDWAKQVLVQSRRSKVHGLHGSYTSLLYLVPFFWEHALALQSPVLTSWLLAKFCPTGKINDPSGLCRESSRQHAIPKRCCSAKYFIAVLCGSPRRCLSRHKFTKCEVWHLSVRATDLSKSKIAKMQSSRVVCKYSKVFCR